MKTTIYDHVMTTSDSLENRKEEIRLAQTEDHKNYLKRRLYEDAMRHVFAQNGLTMRQARQFLKKVIVLEW